MVKNLSVMWETWVQSLGWGDPLEEGMATPSSILAWRIPMDRGAWQATVHGVIESDTTEQLSTPYPPPAKETERAIQRLCLHHLSSEQSIPSYFCLCLRGRNSRVKVISNHNALPSSGTQ